MVVCSRLAKIWWSSLSSRGSIAAAGQLRDIRVAILNYKSAIRRCKLLQKLTLLFSLLFYRQVSANANIGQRTIYDGWSCQYCVFSMNPLTSLYNFPFFACFVLITLTIDSSADMPASFFRLSPTVRNSLNLYRLVVRTCELPLLRYNCVLLY